MNKEHAAVGRLIEKLQQTVDDYRANCGMCYAAAIGCLEIVKCDLLAEMVGEEAEKVEPKIQKCSRCSNTADNSSFMKSDLCTACWRKDCEAKENEANADK